MSQSKQENGSLSISGEGKVVNYNPELELAEAIDEFELMANVDGRSEKTLDLYNYVFGRFTDFLSEEIAIGSISTKQIRKYLAELIEEDLKRTTVAIHHRVLNAFFTWLVEEGFLKKSPTEQVDEPKTPDKHPKVLSKDQVEKISDMKKYDKPIICVAPGGEYTHKITAKIEDEGIPVYQTPEEAVEAMWGLAECGKCGHEF